MMHDGDVGDEELGCAVPPRSLPGRIGLNFSMAVVAVPFILHLRISTFQLFQIL